MGHRSFSNSGAGADMNPDGEWRTPKQIVEDAQREAAEQPERDIEDQE
jgi:hypothetical protein